MALLQQDIIYFILTDRFFGKANPNPELKKDTNKKNPGYFHGGNIDGIIEKIPYLKKLGVTVLWITPVYLQINLSESKGYHGYWALDFNQTDPHFYIDNGNYPKGSKLYIKDLVDALHAQGIKLMLDMVVNHTGYCHPGLTDSVPNPTPIRSSWFKKAEVTSKAGEKKVEELSSLPILDLDISDVSDYHINTILDWIKITGIDAIRMDTVKNVERLFWNDYKTQVRGFYPDVSLLGEALEYDIDKISEFQKYYAFDSLFDFPMQDAIKKVFLEDQSVNTFVSPLQSGTGLFEKDSHYNNHNKLATLLDNHDLSARFATWALIKCKGDKEKAAKAIKLGLSFLFTIRGIPQIYYGTEIGMQGGADPDNRNDFEWNKFDHDYNVKAEYKFEKDIFDHTCKMIAIRKENPALTCGNFVYLFVDYFIAVFLRYVEDNVVIIAVHNGWLDMPTSIEIEVDTILQIPARIRNLIRHKKMTCQITGETVNIENGELQLRLKAKSAVILK